MDYHSQNRHKRRINQNLCDIESTNEKRSCCLYPLEINFDDFGWDWIIAPKSYKANYCTGECDDFDSDVYLHLMKQVKGSHPRCCVPKKTLPLQIIYLDEQGNLFNNEIADMTIEKCGCA